MKKTLTFCTFLLCLCLLTQCKDIPNPSLQNVKVKLPRAEKKQAFETIKLTQDSLIWREKEYKDIKLFIKEFSKQYEDKNLNSSDVFLYTKKDISVTKIIPILELKEKLDIDIIIESID